MVENKTGGYLTTHVLDTMVGRPASGMKIELFRLTGDQRALLCSVKTNADGRCDAPVLSGTDFVTGTYELCFFVGAYLKNLDIELPQPAFLDMVPVRFGIGDASAHYHVPLLVSPWSYSTYRGS